MRKKILCVIMSAVMVVGALTGCGSSSGDTSKEISKETSVEDRPNELEQTVLTQITPGKSKVDDVKAFLKSQGVTFSANSSDISGTTFGLFLEHECNYDNFYYDKKEKITDYGIEIGFEDATDYSHSYQEISDYVEKLSLGVTGEVNDDEDVEGGTEWETEEGEKISTYYLVDDSDDYMTIIEFSAFSNFYEDWDGYNTLIAIGYTYIPKKNIKPSDSDGIYNWVWKDKNGKEYTPKVIKNIQKNKGNDLKNSTESIYREDSTESTYREDSTEVSQQENSNSTAGKQAYDVEEEVNKIRDIYYWVQGDSSNLTKQDGGSVTRWIDSNGKIRKIVAPAGTYDDTNGAGAAKYNAEFYYNENEALVFVFLYSGKEEHRLYVMQGKCVRYIDQDRSINDYPELKEADRVCGLGYFIGLGMLEIHYAYV